ncbi:thioredoxin [Candidatus Desantisbacteria bacterium CG1_02_38_46]|uniref:Thioredoxin n=3 Tax=unclassified Candidatus Desantisiibacteriota TaxID=3106372 RepID=A0A2H9PAH3_9BACT|nr:MAG: thioredoxin [Candidatus Desantisbacteria bacterium CG1_02_38_46]PIU51430.1 MAG: thioredoxin [Candidatus Desantisbacteria bacterium CG07_land_8_20_14_0_80_39_15]PIZ15465.1 MAG: thioredoxin [Candidatus Desantisbacteria bacterium CG_4_10_14_0_8_um_filter_39_17]
MVEVNGENFQKEVLEKSKEKPVLVDFWAEWCAPCIMLSPTLEKLEKKYKEKFILAKVNVDENQALASQYRIMSIPNVKLFKEGEMVDEFVGVLPEKEIVNFLERNGCVSIVLP